MSIESQNSVIANSTLFYFIGTSATEYDKKWYWWSIPIEIGNENRKFEPQNDKIIPS